MSLKRKRTDLQGAQPTTLPQVHQSHSTELLPVNKDKSSIDEPLFKTATDRHSDPEEFRQSRKSVGRVKKELSKLGQKLRDTARQQKLAIEASEFHLEQSKPSEMRLRPKKKLACLRDSSDKQSNEPKATEQDLVEGHGQHEKMANRCRLIV